MKKLLSLLKTTLFYLVVGILGWVFGESILTLATYPYDVLIWCGMICGFLYLYRNHRDGFVQLFKDVHQSNLDDIEEQQPQENTKSISVQKEIQTSLKKIFKNIVGLGIAASILWVVGLAFGIFEFNDGSFKYLILSVPGVLIAAYLIVKSFSVIRDFITVDEVQKKEVET
ncbi:hypothetical protein OAK33_01680 [Candidatus Thioglobus sp.]|nr:hypothetical protein [Candidatus Thioglobus sp.]